jgi:hypothetical protein
VAGSRGELHPLAGMEMIVIATVATLHFIVHTSSRLTLSVENCLKSLGYSLASARRTFSNRASSYVVTLTGQGGYAKAVKRVHRYSPPWINVVLGPIYQAGTVDFAIRNLYRDSHSHSPIQNIPYQKTHCYIYFEGRGILYSPPASPQVIC